MITHVARQGQIIGKFAPDELRQALRNGTIREADHWWRAGMKDWIMVSNQSPLIPDQKPAWPPFPGAGNKTMIHNSKNDSPARESCGCCTMSGKLRREIFHSLKLIEFFKAQMHADTEKGPGEVELNVNHLREEIESARRDIETLNQHRAEYWVGLIEVSKNDDEETLMSMHIMHQDLLPAIHHGLIRPDQAMEPVELSVPVELNNRLFRLANRLPKIPSQDRVVNILKKLDEKSLTWDDNQPELLLVELLKFPR